MPLPDVQTFFNPNENISSQDAVLISNLAVQIHKTFVSNFITLNSCRFSGFVPSFSNNGTPSPSLNFTPGLILFTLPNPKNITDPNGYSGAIFSGSSSSIAPLNSFGITPPVSGTRTDSIDIYYQEQLGASGGIGSTDPRDIIASDGTITPNVPTQTRSISYYGYTYTQNSNTTPVATDSIRICTFTVTSSGLCTMSSYLSSIWENQVFPGTPNTAEQSNCLYDNLSAIRSQISSIIGQGSWYGSVTPPILSLLQQGNTATFWGGTDTGIVNEVFLTIQNYPTPNADIIVGTSIFVTPAVTNTSGVTLFVNANSVVDILDQNGNVMSPGKFVGGQLYLIVNTGPGTYQLTGYASSNFYFQNQFEVFPYVGHPVTFTTSNFTNSITVEMVSGGGGGGGWGNSNFNGGGGGSGAYAKLTILVSPNTTYTLQVGGGGGDAGNGADGGNGGPTYFIGPSSFTYEVGGGQGALFNNSGGGGNGGGTFNLLPASSPPSALVLAAIAGSGGTTGTAASGSSGTGGAGGGLSMNNGAYPFSIGGAAAGGFVSGSTLIPGDNGNTYGGGGGGSIKNSNSGSGANGIMIIYY